MSNVYSEIVPWLIINTVTVILLLYEDKENEITQELMINNNYNLVINKSGKWKFKENVIGNISVYANNVMIDMNNYSLQRHYDYQYAIVANEITDFELYDGSIYFLSLPKTSLEEIAEIADDKNNYFSLLPPEILYYIYNFMTNKNLLKKKGYMIEKFNKIGGLFSTDSSKVMITDIKFLATKENFIKN